MYKHNSQKSLKKNAHVHFIRNVISPNPKKSEPSTKSQVSLNSKKQYAIHQINTYHHQRILHSNSANSPLISNALSKQNNPTLCKLNQSLVNTPRKVEKVHSIRDQYQSIKIVLNFDGLSLQSTKSNSQSIKLSKLELDIAVKKNILKESFFFYFDESTTIKQLLNFLLQKIKGKGIKVAQQLIYFESGNMHIDFFFSLKNEKVCDIPFDCLNLKARRLTKYQIKTSLNAFEIIKCIGSGGFSKVFLARAYGMLMAIKVIPKEIIVDSGKQSIIQNQKYILTACKSHPFVTKLYLAMETNKYIIFGMEYCNGGELFNLLRKVKRMTQEQAKFYFLQTLSVISFLHQNKIVYRDLKPENIILDNEGHIRLADYGLSKLLEQRQKSYSFCGSAQYMAPEMLMRKGHSYEVDYYCLGALLYELVTGLPPYYSKDQNQLFNNIINKDLSFPNVNSNPQNAKNQISPQLKEFLAKLLSKNTNERFKNIKQMFSFKWFESVDMNSVLMKKLEPPFKTANFDYNFDDQQFIDDQKVQIKRLQIEKDNGQVRSPMFLNFDYQAEEIIKVKNEIQHSLQQKQKPRGFKKFQNPITHQSLIPVITDSINFSVNQKQPKQFWTDLPLTSKHNLKTRAEMQFKMHQSNSKMFIRQNDDKNIKLNKQNFHNSHQNKYSNIQFGKLTNIGTIFGKQSLNNFETNQSLTHTAMHHQSPKVGSVNAQNFNYILKSQKQHYQNSAYNGHNQSQNNDIYYSPKNDSQKYSQKCFMNIGKGRMSHQDLKVPLNYYSINQKMEVSFQKNPTNRNGVLTQKYQSQKTNYFQKNKKFQQNIQVYECGKQPKKIYTQKSKSNLFSNIKLEHHIHEQNCQLKNSLICNNKKNEHLSAEKLNQITCSDYKPKDKSIAKQIYADEIYKSKTTKNIQPILSHRKFTPTLWKGYQLKKK